MSLSGAEKAGIAGAILLAGGVVAIALLFLLPGPAPSRAAAGAAGERPATGTAAAAPGGPAPAAGPAGGAGEGTAPAGDRGARRERERLKEEIRRRDLRIAELEKRLRDANLPIRDEAPDPDTAAQAALERLRACGPATSPADIDGIVRDLVATGSGGVGAMSRFLERDLDVSFADGWSYLGGRFLSYPSLRAAVIDAVRQIGGIEGQSALLRELRRTRDPLETLILLAALGNVGHLPTLDAARVDAARRYLDGDPAPREEFFLTTLFDAIAIQESSRAAADLARFAAVPGRSATAVDLGLRRLADLPAEAAVPALAEVATGGGSDRTAELAADLLVGRTGQAVPPALSKVLAAAGEGVRRRIYQGIGAPVRRMVKDLENEGGRGGLQLLDRLAALESEVAARRKVLEGERREETKPEAFRDLDAARKSLTALAARTEELAGKFRR